MKVSLALLLVWTSGLASGSHHYWTSGRSAIIVDGGLDEGEFGDDMAIDLGIIHVTAFILFW